MESFRARTLRGTMPAAPPGPPGHRTSGSGRSAALQFEIRLNEMLALLGTLDQKDNKPNQKRLSCHLAVLREILATRPFGPLQTVMETILSEILLCLHSNRVTAPALSGSEYNSSGVLVEGVPYFVELEEAKKDLARAQREVKEIRKAMIDKESEMSQRVVNSIPQEELERRDASIIMLEYELKQAADEGEKLRSEIAQLKSDHETHMVIHQAEATRWENEKRALTAELEEFRRKASTQEEVRKAFAGLMVGKSSSSTSSDKPGLGGAGSFSLSGSGGHGGGPFPPGSAGSGPGGDGPGDLSFASSRSTSSPLDFTLNAGSPLRSNSSSGTGTGGLGGPNSSGTGGGPPAYLHYAPPLSLDWGMEWVDEVVTRAREERAARHRGVLGLSGYDSDDGGDEHHQATSGGGGHHGGGGPNAQSKHGGGGSGGGGANHHTGASSSSSVGGVVGAGASLEGLTEEMREAITLERQLIVLQTAQIDEYDALLEKGGMGGVTPGGGGSSGGSGGAGAGGSIGLSTGLVAARRQFVEEIEALHHEIVSLRDHVAAMIKRAPGGAGGFSVAGAVAGADIAAMLSLSGITTSGSSSYNNGYSNNNNSLNNSATGRGPNGVGSEAAGNDGDAALAAATGLPSEQVKRLGDPLWTKYCKLMQVHAVEVATLVRPISRANRRITPLPALLRVLERCLCNKWAWEAAALLGGKIYRAEGAVAMTVHEYFYQELEERYAVPSVMLTMAESILLAVKQWRHRCATVRLFYLVFTGECDDATWRYTMYWRRALAKSPVHSFDDFHSLLLALYPGAKETSLQSMQEDFVTFAATGVIPAPGGGPPTTTGSGIGGIVKGMAGTRGSGAATSRGSTGGGAPGSEGASSGAGGASPGSPSGSNSSGPFGSGAAGSTPAFAPSNSMAFEFLAHHLLAKTEPRFKKWLKILRWKDTLHSNAFGRTDFMDIAGKLFPRAPPSTIAVLFDICATRQGSERVAIDALAMVACFLDVACAEPVLPVAEVPAQPFAGAKGGVGGSRRLACPSRG
eukprot:jgi/Mesvir1/9413/Mv01516-RA.1